MSPTFADPLVITMQWVFVVAWAIAIITLLWLRRNGSPYLLAALTLVALTSHQIEEYLVAPLLLGEEYHFLNWAWRRFDHYPRRQTPRHHQNARENSQLCF